MTTLPGGWTTRRPTLDDVPLILPMVHAAHVAAVGYPDFTADDVTEALTVPHTDPAVDSWLAFDPDGRLAGWCYPENPSAGPREFIEVYVHPDGGEPARRPLLDLILNRAVERAAGFGHPVTTVRGGAVPCETDWVRTLTDAGFTFVKRYARMTRPLAGFTPAPPPPGVTVRPVRDAELPEFHALLEEAFVDSLDHEPTDYDGWRARIAALPSVSFDEWFVALVDGEWAGVLMSADQNVVNGEGWVRMLAVRRAYRRRGIGAALLSRAFATYAAKGRTAAGLGVDLTNPTEPASLYRAMGLTASFEADMYERTIDVRAWTSGSDATAGR